MKTLTATQVITYTNERLNNWYIDAEDCGIDGNASASVNDEGAMVITYTENGVTGEYKLMYWEDQAIDWVFNVWSENANLENDKVA